VAKDINSIFVKKSIQPDYIEKNKHSSVINLKDCPIHHMEEIVEEQKLIDSQYEIEKLKIILLILYGFIKDFD
jgi:hypothetical protein